jgi:large subunit ribosomal protein L24
MVMAGKDKGKSGKVLRALPKTMQVIVEGMNVQKHHTKAKRDTKQGSGIVEVSAPIHVSNVMVMDPKENKPTRVGIVRDEASKKNVRTTKKSGSTLK